MNKFAQSSSSKLEKQLSGTLETFRFIGNIFDLYLTRVRDTLLEMGKDKDEDEMQNKEKDT